MAPGGPHRGRRAASESGGPADDDTPLHNEVYHFRRHLVKLNQCPRRTAGRKLPGVLIAFQRDGVSTGINALRAKQRYLEGKSIGPLPYPRGKTARAHRAATRHQLAWCAQRPVPHPFQSLLYACKTQSVEVNQQAFPAAYVLIAKGKVDTDSPWRPRKRKHCSWICRRPMDVGISSG